MAHIAEADYKKGECDSRYANQNKDAHSKIERSSDGTAAGAVLTQRPNEYWRKLRNLTAKLT